MLRNVICRTTAVSRAKGHTAIGGAAYRAGENLKARGQGADGGDKWFRYSGRKDVVREAFIMTHEGAPDYAKAQNRQELWNRVEEIETRSNARLGREIQLGFAYELSHADQRELLEEFVQREAIDRGFVADIAIHDYGRTRKPAISGGTEADMQEIRSMAAEGLPFLERDEARNIEDAHVRVKRDTHGNVTGYQRYQPHAHVRITPRIASEGEWQADKSASRELNKHETAMNWRYDWAKLQNQYLERAGSDVRVTCTPEDEGGFPVFSRGAEVQPEAYAIAQRLEKEPKTEVQALQWQKHEEAQAKLEADAEFRLAHNDSLRHAFIDQHTEASDPDSSQKREYRIAEWYRNVGRRIDHWRDALPQRAAEWRERLSAMKPRLQTWFGYEPLGTETNFDGRDPPTQQRPEPEQDR